MRSHEQATVWGTHIGVGRSSGRTGWYQLLREWRAARAQARQQAKLDALQARWDAKREAVKPLRAEPAVEMAIAQGVLSLATQPYSLIQ
jgi:hypothetical protein